jgi:hypothetical protein
LRVEKVNEIGDASPKVMGCVLEQSGRSRISLPGGIDNGGERELLVITPEQLTLWINFSQSIDNAWRSGVRFKAAVTSTPAQSPIQFQAGVSPFSRTIGRTPVEGAVIDDASTDTRTYKEYS